MIQTWALLVDAYRELNSRKLFWIVLFLSGLIVACFAGIGINPRGLTILFWEIPVPILNSNLISEALFYRMMFLEVGVSIWLGWAAAILALISTAGIFPDFLASGSIELTLSKPISRSRLFLTKYLTGLLFVAVQVTVFAVASFIVIGLRGKVWDPRLFWAIPLVLSFFSYLYCFSVLVALLTRSTMGAFLITILLWALIFLVHLADTVVLQFKVREDQIVSLQQAELDATTTRLQTARSRAQQPDTDAQPPQNDRRVETLETDLARWNERLDESLKDQRLLTRAHAIIYAVKTVLPKTAETIELLRRIVVENTELERLQDQAMATAGSASPRAGIEQVGGVRVSQRALQKEHQRIIDSRSVGWVVGTSLAFEGVLLIIGAWVFSRRDF